MIDDLISRQVDGLLLASVDARSTRLANLRRVGLASVMIDCPVPVPGYVSIGSNVRAGSQRVVEHLIEVHGHTVIALVVGEGVPGADQREQGWQSATRTAGLPDGPLARTSFSREGGYEAANRLLDTRNPPTAIFASSDLQAVGALRAIRDRGLSVPEDVAVVAFDGTKESEFTLAADDGGPSTHPRDGGQCRPESAVSIAGTRRVRGVRDGSRHPAVLRLLSHHRKAPE